MKSTNNAHYKTLIIPEESVDTIRQKLGNEFIWRFDESSNLICIMEKSKPNQDFLTEFGMIMPESANEWYTGGLANKWDD